MTVGNVNRPFCFVKRVKSRVPDVGSNLRRGMMAVPQKCLEDSDEGQEENTFIKRINEKQ